MAETKQAWVPELSEFSQFAQNRFQALLNIEHINSQFKIKELYHHFSSQESLTQVQSGASFSKPEHFDQQMARIKALYQAHLN